MKTRAFLALMVGVALLVSSSPARGQKLKLASLTRINPMFFLPVFAAEEKGFWKENGLEIEWVPFDGAPPMYRAAAAKEISVGMDAGTNPILSASRGLSVKIISELDRYEGFFVYVLGKSPIHEAKNLKGTRVGVSGLGGTGHAYGQVMARSLRMEKEIRFVGSGGVAPSIAALKAGAIDALITTIFTLPELKVKGEVRDPIPLDEYLPKPWLARVVWADKEFIKEKGDLVRRMVRALLQGNRFWKNDSAWAIANIRATMGASEEAARELLKVSQPSEDGRLQRKAVENVRAFLIEYNLIAKDKAPPVEELYTEEFVRPR